MGEDFVWFFVLMLIWCFPFSGIYLILYTLNWNKRKNLFSDSWFVFLTWVFSSISVFTICEINKYKFYYIRGLDVDLLVIFSIIFVNIFAVSGVLYLRSRSGKTSIVKNYNDEAIQRPNIVKILQTSATVSFLTLLMIISLFLAIKDIGERFEKAEPKNQDDVSFEFYE